MRICSKCGIEKQESEFYKAKNKSGLYPSCKSCKTQVVNDFNKTKSGVIVKIYSSQKLTSKRRGYASPDYSKEQLEQWCLSQPIFNKLFDEWVQSGYNSDLKPSCDRINDYESYVLSNMKVVTWKQNRERIYMDQKTGVNNKSSKAVVGENIRTGKFVEFYSQKEASRVTGISNANI
jgi:hypothetical protein